MPALLGVATLSTTALLVSTAGPAAAAPVEGTVHSNSYAEFGNDCDITNGAESQTTAYRSGQGERTAYAHGEFLGEMDDGSHVRGALGESETTTTAVATARNRAFKKVEVEVSHVVVLTNDSALDCGMEVHALSESDGMLRVRQPGRIRIKWSGTGGDVSSIALRAPSGRMLISRDPSTVNGTATVNVRTGLFTWSSQLRTSLSESAVPLDDSTILLNTFKVEVTYLPPA